MDYGEKVLYGLILLSALGFFSWRNTCISIIEELGIVPAYYPDKYRKPSKLISKIYNLPKKVLPSVPRFIFVQQYITLMYPLMACAFVVLRLTVSLSKAAAEHLLLFTAGTIILNEVCFYCFDFKWKRKKRKENKDKV